jgi:hypothetical protein
MIVTVQIETKTAAGLKLITELRRYPDVVRFVEPNQISEPIPEEMDIESLSVNDSAKLAFDRLGEKYDRKFNNKYTR